MDYAINPALMGDKPGHREQSLRDVNSMYFSPQDIWIWIWHQLHVEMGLLSSQMGLFTLVNHTKFNKASALCLTGLQDSCFRSGLQEHTSSNGASISSITFLHPTNPTDGEPTPCPHPLLMRARQPEGCWGRLDMFHN